VKWASVNPTKEPFDLHANQSGHFCLYAGSIPAGVTEEAIRSIFEKYGEIVLIKIRGKQSEDGYHQFAFIEYSNGDSAVTAMKELDDVLTFGESGKPCRRVFAFQC
jgi:RNA recognition motif-containing protein